MMSNKIKDALFGIAVGDAIGVPYEFLSRNQMQKNPAIGMIGYGTHNQPEGTWSDDSSLMFCLAESLARGYDLADISRKFVAWKYTGYWTPWGKVFDIGITTSKAIARLKEILDSKDYNRLKLLKLHDDEYENGNGSLMRILPLLFYIKGKNIQAQFDIIWEVSALTHRHIRSAMCCLIYLRVAEHLLNGYDKVIAYQNMRKEIFDFWSVIKFSEKEQKHFYKIIQKDIRDTPIKEIKTGGYVMESIEACLWFFLNENDYEHTILSIINLGHDTDTSAAIVGGLAGIYYGSEGIPQQWIDTLARLEDILELIAQLNDSYT